MTGKSTLKVFDEEALTKLIESFKLHYGNFKYIKSKHQLNFLSSDSDISIRLPFSFSIDKELLRPANFSIMLIHSGEAALAYSEEDQIIEHKMVKAYMVRQKQGKSQIKHLKTKGKSKAGSRVRLAGTEHFFEEINSKISEWDQYFAINRIALSCNKTLQPYFFNRSDAALNKDDERLFKIPKHIQEANFDNLTVIHNYLISTELNFNDEDRYWVDNMISILENE